MAKRAYQELTTKLIWSTDDKDITTAKLQASCLMRIADAVEKSSENLEVLTKDYSNMKRSLKWYKQKYHEHLERIEHLENSRAGHKAAYTKLKNKVENGGNY